MWPPANKALVPTLAPASRDRARESRAVLHWPLPLSYIHLGCDPTSVTELHWEEHEGYAVPRATRINDTSHWMS